ncbi:MAG TPA: YbhB/YbcL family Raf kinase inhibitor-like protein [Stellaceae bacterium]|jgi:Raf kinase inhibitor-like YbhB/YbcL family protein|nr:YbhB/YbcL family Raf kinase inhibitor-like protein [Stellaceae bacterium]
MLENLPAGLGRALSGIRAGSEKLVYHDEALAEVPEDITVTSPAFADGEELPQRFTEDGEGLSPPLEWSGMPEAAKAIMLIAEDADSPTPNPLVHAIVWNLDAVDGSLEEGAMPAAQTPGLSPPMGVNSLLRLGYLPPDPPPGHGPHSYAFQVFALSAQPLFETVAPGRTELVDALHAFAIAKGMLIATCERE